MPTILDGSLEPLSARLRMAMRVHAVDHEHQCVVEDIVDVAAIRLCPDLTNRCRPAEAQISASMQSVTRSSFFTATALESVKKQPHAGTEISPGPVWLVSHELAPRWWGRLREALCCVPAHE